MMTPQIISLSLLPAFPVNTGIGPADFIYVTRNIGLEPIPDANMTFDGAFIECIHKKYAATRAAGDGCGLPNVNVITGVDPDGTLCVNDPGWPIKQAENMRWFNERIAREFFATMMYLP